MINTNWPNPERPGVPMFPERSGRHHVGGNLLFWYSDIQQWVTVSPIRACKEPEAFAGDEYHGPVLTPTQIAEMLAGERERVIAEAVPKILVDLAELPDRTSPDDLPDVLSATTQEIERIITDNIRNLGDAP